jgi:carbon monoxide dehydrogenase subunit G
VPSAQFDRTIEVSADAANCWKILTDVGRVAGWVSIVGAVDERERLRSYGALLEDRMGPFRLRADLDIQVRDVVEGRSISLRAEGEDRQVASRIAVDATLRIDDRSGAQGAREGATVSVEGTYEVTGKIATLGASMIRSKAGKLLDEFFSAAERELA